MRRKSSKTRSPKHKSPQGVIAETVDEEKEALDEQAVAAAISEVAAQKKEIAAREAAAAALTSTSAPTPMDTEPLPQNLGGRDAKDIIWAISFEEYSEDRTVLRLLTESFARSKKYDPTFTVLSTDNGYVNIKKLGGSSPMALQALFNMEITKNEKTGKYRYSFYIEIASLKSLADIKARGMLLQWLTKHRIWVKQGHSTMTHMKRVAWIWGVPKGSVCPVQFSKTVIATVAQHMSDPEVAETKKRIQTHKGEPLDEYNGFSRDDLAAYLWLDWNLIKYGNNQTGFAKCQAMEFTCPQYLIGENDGVPGFDEMLIRIFEDASRFPVAGADIMPAETGKFASYNIALSKVHEQQALFEKWRGLEIHNVWGIDRIYTGKQTIREFILQQTCAKHIGTSIDTAEKGMYILMVPRDAAVFAAACKFVNTTLQNYFLQPGIQKKGWGLVSTYRYGPPRYRTHRPI